MKVVEATAADRVRLQELFLQSPVDAGTSFVLDRSPDFGALLRRKGEARTFVAISGDRLAGSASALWHDAYDAQRRVRIGEILDLRVADFARGGLAARHLLDAVRAALRAARVEWIVCLIGDANDPATPLVSGRAGFQKLEPLARYASVHYIAWKGRTPRHHALRVERVRDADRPKVVDLLQAAMRRRRFAPEGEIWPAGGDHLGWVARDGDGNIVGALLAWDGEEVRRIRIARYRRSDAPLRIVTGLASRLGFVSRLPDPGGTLHLWATRGVVAYPSAHTTSREVCHQLIRTALHAAAAAGRNVLQVNLSGSDPLLEMLPRYPRSTYWSTLYGAPLDGSCTPDDLKRSYYADVALA